MFQEWFKKYEKLIEENNMSEEKILKNIKEMIQWSDHNTYKMALQGLLDLYNKEKLNSLNLSEQLNKEKEKNKKLFEEYNKRVATIIKYEQEIKEIRNKVSLDKYTYEDFEEDLTKILEE